MVLVSRNLPSRTAASIRVPELTNFNLRRDDGLVSRGNSSLLGSPVHQTVLADEETRKCTNMLVEAHDGDRSVSFRKNRTCELKLRKRQK